MSLEDSIDKSAGAAGMGHTVEASLQEIVEKARLMDEWVAEIATASGEPHTGTDYVDIAVSEIDRVT